MSVIYASQRHVRTACDKKEGVGRAGCWGPHRGTAGGLTHAISVRNDCTNRVRIKVVLSGHADDRCRELAAGDGFTLTVARTADLDRVELC
jgi:hypothetical protein